MNRFSRNPCDSVFVEEDTEKDIAEMYKLLILGDVPNIQRHFSMQSKSTPSSLQKVANAQINRHVGGLSHRNKATLKTLLKKVEVEGFNWHEIKTLH